MKKLILFVILLSDMVYAKNDQNELKLVSIDLNTHKMGHEEFAIIQKDRKEYFLRLVTNGKTSTKILIEQEAKSFVLTINDYAWNSEYKEKYTSKKCTQAALVVTNTVSTKICNEERAKLISLIGIIGKLKSR